MAQLVTVIAFHARGGPHDGGEFVVGEHRTIVGSDRDCDFVLAEPGVAGEHASFKLINSHVEVHDLGTHSGTFVNGARIAAPALLSTGDEVKIGSTVLTEIVKEQETAVEPAAVPAAVVHETPAAPTVAAPVAPTEVPTTPPPGVPPKRGRGFKGPHARRNYLIAAGAFALLAAIVVGVLLLTSGGKSPLTMQQVVAKDKASTLMVISRSRGVSPVSGNSGVFAGGSAWVYDAQRGLIVTNAHVLMGGDTFEAGYQQSDLTTATVVGVDARDDIAVLHVAPGDLPGLKTLQRAAASGVQQGGKAYVLGYPGNASSQTDFFRTPFQATDGTISAKGVQANVNTDAWGASNDNATLLLSNLYQTTAAINAGASGGPMVDQYGNVIGMNVASGQEAQHYAIPISTINRIVPQLAQGRSIGWLGIGVSALPSSVANAWSLDGGMVVTSVVKDTPADQSGLSDYLAFAGKPPFDYLVLGYINGQQVTTMQAYVNAVSQLQSGQQATIRVGRFSPNGYYHGYRDFKVTVP